MIAWAGIFKKKMFNVKSEIVKSRWPLDDCFFGTWIKRNFILFFPKIIIPNGKFTLFNQKNSHKKIFYKIKN